MAKYELIYTDDFLEQIDWLKKYNKEPLKKIRQLCCAIEIDPRRSIGNPERLVSKENIWSRKIDKKNRLVYEILDGNQIKIASCKDHYNDH